MSDLESRENPYNVRQASRIYFLPNLMTAGNLFCGFVSVIKCIQARMAADFDPELFASRTPSQLYTQAVWCILGAVVFDSLDGRLARMGGRESLFGAEFDSLADVISFGVAPALMVFFLILSPTQGIEWFRQTGWLLGFIYLLCAAVRLARFNVITNPLLIRAKKESSKDFIGLPVPAAAGTVASLVLLLLNFSRNNRELGEWALALPILLLLIAMLMVSTIRYPSFKQIDWQLRIRSQTLVIFVFVVVCVVALREVALLPIFLIYIFYGIFGQWRRIRRIRKARDGLSAKV